MQRRAVLKGLTVGSAIMATPLSAVADDADNQGATPAASGPEPPTTERAADGPWSLLAPWTEGAALEAGWSVGQLGPLEQGAAVLTLIHRRGDRARVHVCRRRGTTHGVAGTSRLDLVLMNGGNGAQLTHPAIARAIEVLAGGIRKHEHGQREDVSAPSGLLSHDARLSWYGSREILV